MKSPDPQPRPAEEENPPCGGCGGPHPFDTSVPSVLWNRVVRVLGGSEYLCLTCVVAHFARAGVSFTAELYGRDFSGLPLDVRVLGHEATAAKEIQDENNALRYKLRCTEDALAAAQAESPSRAEVEALLGDVRTARGYAKQGLAHIAADVLKPAEEKLDRLLSRPREEAK